MSRISLYTVDFISETLSPTLPEPGLGRRQTQHAFLRSASTGLRGITLRRQTFSRAQTYGEAPPRCLPSQPPCRCPPSPNCARLGRGVLTPPNPTSQSLSRGLPTALGKRGSGAGSRRSTLQLPDPARPPLTLALPLPLRVWQRQRCTRTSSHRPAAVRRPARLRTSA